MGFCFEECIKRLLLFTLHSPARVHLPEWKVNTANMFTQKHVELKQREGASLP